MAAVAYGGGVRWQQQHLMGTLASTAMAEYSNSSSGDSGSDGGRQDNNQLKAAA
jgi:hypothetical protein